MAEGREEKEKGISVLLSFLGRQSTGTQNLGLDARFGLKKIREMKGKIITKCGGKFVLGNLEESLLLIFKPRLYFLCKSFLFVEDCKKLPIAIDVAILRLRGQKLLKGEC